MDWRALWDRNARKIDKNAQVSRTGKSDISDAELDRIAAYIANIIGLSSSDSLLDVCCGNGTITSRLVKYCHSATGIDFSEVQIKNAKAQNWPDIDFMQGDALELSRVVKGPFDHIICHFSFQYFDSYAKGYRVLQNMSELLKPGGNIFLGDIPDHHRKQVFFPLWEPRIRHEIRRTLGREPMGRFWKKESLNKLADKLGLEGKAIVQPQDFLYAHYRFDYLIHKPK